MEEVESLARLMYWLEMDINHNGDKSKLEEQDKATQEEWQRCARSVIRLTYRKE